jgi:hypothetical protein
MNMLDTLEEAEKFKRFDPINWIQAFRAFAAKERIKPYIRDRIIPRLTLHRCEEHEECPT